MILADQAVATGRAGLTIGGAYQRKAGALFSYVKPGFSQKSWRPILVVTFKRTLNVQTSKQRGKNLAADRRGPPCDGGPSHDTTGTMDNPAMATGPYAEELGTVRLNRTEYRFESNWRHKRLQESMRLSERTCSPLNDWAPSSLTSDSETTITCRMGHSFTHPSTRSLLRYSEKGGSLKLRRVGSTRTLNQMFGK